MGHDESLEGCRFTAGRVPFGFSWLPEKMIQKKIKDEILTRKSTAQDDAGSVR